MHIVMQHDDRFLARAIAPEAQITYPPSWRWRLFTQLQGLGTPAPNIDLDGQVRLTSGFLEPRGDFHAKINFPDGPAVMDLRVSHPRALWEIDVINLTWTPKATPTPSPTPVPSVQPTPRPPRGRKVKDEKRRDRSVLNHAGARVLRVFRRLLRRRNLDHVFGIVVDQLEPVFGDIGRRENIVLGELGLERELQIVFADSSSPSICSRLHFMAMARLIAVAFARSTIEAMIAPLSRSLR